MKALLFVRVKALRNVGIGANRHLEPGQTALVLAEEAYFLSLAGQVSILDEPAAIADLASPRAAQTCFP